MKYSFGDCLSIPLSTDHYIIVFVAMNYEDSYHLAFLDYHETRQPSADYFENCSFFVTMFGMDEQRFVAFEAVTIDTSALDNDPAVTRIAHLNLPGQLGLNGLAPMTGISDIVSYFEQHLKNYESQEPDPYSPFKRSSMHIKELAKYATPTNPFATVKLYREESGTIYFWQIYGNAELAGLVISQGKLGMVGEFAEVKDLPLDKLKEIYVKLSEEKKGQGFQEWEEFSNMILQFETNDAWGAEEDLEFRNDIWEYLDRYLFWTGNGAITGGDIGSGTVNLFFQAISPDMAISTIAAALTEKQTSRPYVIALEDNSDIRVLYPANYTGDFNY